MLATRPGGRGATADPGSATGDAALEAPAAVASPGRRGLVGRLSGGCQVLYCAATNTLIQILVPGRLRGRVLSLYLLTSTGLMPVGNVLAGFVAERVSPTVTLAGAGLLTLAGAVVAAVLVPEMRRLASPAAPAPGQRLERARSPGVRNPPDAERWRAAETLSMPAASWVQSRPARDGPIGPAPQEQGVQMSKFSRIARPSSAAITAVAFVAGAALVKAGRAGRAATWAASPAAMAASPAQATDPTPSPI